MTHDTTLNLLSLTAQALLLYFLIFCRIGTVALYIPGFYSEIISNRIKVAFITIFTICIGSTIMRAFPDFTQVSEMIISKHGELHVLQFFLVALSEIMIGTVIGIVILAHTTVLSTCGILLGLGTGLTNVTTSDNYFTMENTAISQLLALCFIALIFITDTHLEILKVATQSYEQIPVFSFFKSSKNMIFSVIRSIADSIAFGVKISMPITLVSILFAIIIGILSRLIPILNIYYVMMPIQFLIGIAVLYFTIATLLTSVLENLHRILASIGGGALG